MGLFLSGANVAVEAGAGAGKTSTLGLLARSTDRVGTYTAFNRSIVQQSGASMPMNVTASTVHGLAMRGAGKPYRRRLDTGRMKSWQLAKHLDVRGLVITVGGKRKVLQPSYLASLVMRGLTVYCASADPAPGPEHLPYIDGIDEHDGAGRRGWANNEKVRDFLADTIAAAWADLSKPGGVLPFGHHVYLKLWQLHDPVIPGEFVMFDECQDATPVMLAAIDHQVERGTQVVYVGDSQQQIYEWLGAVNALASVNADVTTFLTQSFRFGPAIAEVANAVLDELGAALRIVGNPAKPSTVEAVGQPDAILCRSNAVAVETVLGLQRQGKHPHLIGGGEEVLRFAQAAADLERGEGTAHPDLACFDTWGEVKAYVEQDPQGDELKLMVHLIEEYGIAIIIEALDGMVAEEAADLIVSTAHKSKGREWGKVKLAGDFQQPEDAHAGAGEWRLLYVAATRAKDALDLRSCEPLKALVTPDGPRAPQGAHTPTADALRLLVERGGLS